MTKQVNIEVKTTSKFNHVKTPQGALIIKAGYLSVGVVSNLNREYIISTSPRILWDGCTLSAIKKCSELPISMKTLKEITAHIEPSHAMDARAGNFYDANEVINIIEAHLELSKVAATIEVTKEVGVTITISDIDVLEAPFIDDTELENVWQSFTVKRVTQKPICIGNLQCGCISKKKRLELVLSIALNRER